MAPSPGLHLKCTRLTVEWENYSSVQEVSVCVCACVCEIDRETRTDYDCRSKRKHKNCTASVTAVKALTLTVCLVNQICLKVLVIYIMYKCYFYCFGDCSGLMPGQSYVFVTYIDVFLGYVKKCSLKIFVQQILQHPFTGASQFTVWWYKLTIIFVEIFRALVLFVQHYDPNTPVSVLGYEK